LNIYDLAYNVGKDIKTKKVYKDYLLAKTELFNDYTQEMKIITNYKSESKEDYDLVLSTKQKLSSIPIYQKYCNTKLRYQKYLQKILKEITMNVGENIKVSLEL